VKEKIVEVVVWDISMILLIQLVWDALLEHFHMFLVRILPKFVHLVLQVPIQIWVPLIVRFAKQENGRIFPSNASLVMQEELQFCNLKPLLEHV
jgi:hypothetical protein